VQEGVESSDGEIMNRAAFRWGFICLRLMKMILYAGKSLLQLLLQLLIITVKVSNLLSPCLNKLYGPLRDLSKLSQITENYFFYY
jgi:hypothetical protein